MEPFDLREWKQEKNLGICEEIVIDSRRVTTPRSLFVALKGTRTDGHHFLTEAVKKGAKYLLVNSEYKKKIDGAALIPVPSPLKALQEIASLYRKKQRAKVVAITGTHGKTMTKDLLLAFLQTKYRVTSSPESFNSQIGVPLSLLRIRKKDEFALIELGFSKEGELVNLAKIVQPDHTIVTHIGEKYLPNQTVIDEINHLLKAVNGWSFLPDHPKLRAKNPIPWNQNFARFLTHKHLPSMPYQVDFPDGRKMQGEIQSGFYYFLNLLHLTISPALKMGIETEEIIEKLQVAIPEPVRREIFESPLGATIINDTYSEDPISLNAAIEDLKHLAPGKKPLLLTDDVTPKKVLELEENATKDHVILIKGKKKLPLDAIESSLTNNRLTINLSTITANISKIRSSLPDGCRILAILKAFAYGTDAARLAHHLQKCGIDIIGVSQVEEAVQLRRAGATCEIFVLNANVQEEKTCREHNLQVGVSTLEQARVFQGLKMHLHIDTGMKRFGCKKEEAYALAKEIGSLEGVMTHFSSADDKAFDCHTLSQIKQFDAAIQQLEENGLNIKWRHASNTAALTRFSLPQYNMVRVGLALFGLGNEQLDPALTLTSRIVGINEGEEGESVSYGCNYILKRKSRLAIIPLGYFDGMHRSYSGKGYVMIRGKKAKMVGSICMDYMMVDITDIEDATVNDPVLIFGKDEHGNAQACEKFAKDVGSIPHELITCLGPRIKRIFLYEESLLSRLFTSASKSA